MLTSLALIFLIGMAMAALSEKLGLPRIIGMLFAGILLGPYVFGWLDPTILSVSAELRRMALVIILLKAGLSLNLADLKRVGRPALLMAFVPATFELIAVVLFAPALLGITRSEAAVLGAVLSAVSPAVVVPRMVHLIETRWGTEKSIPQMILAGASLDDVFVVVLFSTFVGMEQGGAASAFDLLQVPVAIVFGIALGLLVGFLLARFFEARAARGHAMRLSVKVLVVLGIAFLLLAAEDALKGLLPLSGLLAVMSMACALRGKLPAAVSARLSAKFGKIWIAAEIVLFVLVGAAVDVRYTLAAGLPALCLLALSLAIRSLGVGLCMPGTPLSRKERLFCVFAYLPKATVQAAIGSVPLALGLPCGMTVLSVAVLAIVVTAPLGAFAIDRSYQKLLQHEDVCEG